jgi:hypothetical protein
MDGVGRWTHGWIYWIDRGMDLWLEEGQMERLERVDRRRDRWPTHLPSPLGIQVL